MGRTWGRAARNISLTSLKIVLVLFAEASITVAQWI